MFIISLDAADGSTALIKNVSNFASDSIGERFYFRLLGESGLRDTDERGSDARSESAQVHSSRAVYL